MAKEIGDWSFDDMVDEATAKVLKKTIRGDMREGVVEAINLVLAWQDAKRRPAGQDVEAVEQGDTTQ